MSTTESTFGLSVIIALYLTIGFFTAAGSIYLSQTLFKPKWEQVFYGAFLIAVAGFYLAFNSHFGSENAWWTELSVVGLFTLTAGIGMRRVEVLIVGYLAHGIWDGIHEYNELFAATGSDALTPTPLAYGFFCAVYDVLMAAYFFTRRKQWRESWKASHSNLVAT